MTGMSHGAEAVGIANIAMDGTVLDTWYPAPKLVASAADALHTAGSERVSAHELPEPLLNLIGVDHDRLVELVPVRTRIHDLAEPPVDAHDVYLRLHLLSHRLVQPLSINMHDCMEHLTEVVWTNKGPCLADNFEYIRARLRTRGTIHVHGIERLPRMVDYVVPTGVSIAEAERVRLGAYLAPGTMVVREGYVSYNAGSLGPARIEGRLSSTVVVGEGTELGLSAALMAQLGDGNNRVPLRVGKRCFLHPSSGVVGVDLGDDCEIGINVMLEPETILYDSRSETHIPASEISGENGLRIAHEPGATTPVVRRSTE